MSLIKRDPFIYSLKGIRELEQKAFTKIDPLELMQRAAHAALKHIQQYYAHAEHIVIYCGAGNNGGDGYWLALALNQLGKKVCIMQVDHEEPSTDLAKKAYKEILARGISCLPFSTENPCFSWEKCQLHVDAILGIGARAQLSNKIIEVLTFLRKQSALIVALDVPTGIDADTGQALTEYAVQANTTITFIAFKLGLLQGQAINACGELFCDDLNCHEDVPQLTGHVQPVAAIIEKKSFPKRLRDTHKGQLGHILIIGSDKGYLGASRLAGMAALRAGAGRVSIATHPAHAAFLQGDCAELMVHGVRDEKDLLPFMQQADFIILGVGLGRGKWSQHLFHAAMQSSLPMLIDADGLYFLSLEKNFQAKNNLILTPHPLEAARLLKCTTEDIQANRLHAIKSLAKQYQATIVLKGARTQVLTDKELPAICLQGHPGMASAGMGDVLSGIIASYAAQGMNAFEAAKQGVFYHASAADDIAQSQGEIGLLASDVIQVLPKVMNERRD